MRSNRGTAVARQLAMVAVALAACGVAPIAASPFVDLTFEARQTGSGNPFSQMLTVTPSTTYDLEILIQFAPLTRSNANGPFTLNSLTYNSDSVNGDGITSLGFDVLENPTAAIQVNFGSGLTLNPNPVASSGTKSTSWNAVTGASGGTPNIQAGASLADELLYIHPVHSSGVQTADTVETLATGTFATAANLPDNSTSSIFGEWNATANSGNGGTGSLKINGTGSSIFLSATTENSGDPYVMYSPLTLNTSSPEPGSLFLLGVPGLWLVMRHRRRFGAVRT